VVFGGLENTSLLGFSRMKSRLAAAVTRIVTIRES
jgi:hypothetical protein